MKNNVVVHTVWLHYCWKSAAESRRMNRYFQSRNNQNMSEKCQKFEFNSEVMTTFKKYFSKMHKFRNFEHRNCISSLDSRSFWWSLELEGYGLDCVTAKGHLSHGHHISYDTLPPILPILHKGLLRLSEHGDLIIETQIILKQLVFGYLSSIFTPYITVFGYFRLKNLATLLPWPPYHCRCMCARLLMWHNAAYSVYHTTWSKC